MLYTLLLKYINDLRLPMKKIGFVLLLLLVSACDNEPEREINYQNLSAYKPDAPYANAIDTCVSVISCSLDELPPIGLKHSRPTVDDIMSRVVVSHDWMGERMRELLLQMPETILLLFRATTAIVIHQDIRPAHYRSKTGAIYIDPNFLWLTNKEKESINKKSDFRQGFGSELNFHIYQRYVIDNEIAWPSFSLLGDAERNLGDIVKLNASLLFHELAHANDCLAPHTYDSLVPDLSIAANINRIADSKECIHQKLIQEFPLESEIWSGLSRVLYHGKKASEEQKALSAHDVGLYFGAADSSSPYAFSSIWEDTAEVVETTLMKYNYNADMDIGFFQRLEDDVEFCTRSFAWGKRGRLAEPSLIQRSRLMMSYMLPSLSFDDFYLNLPQSYLIPEGTSLCKIDFSDENGNLPDSEAINVNIHKMDIKSPHFHFTREAQ